MFHFNQKGCELQERGALKYVENGYHDINTKSKPTKNQRWSRFRQKPTISSKAIFADRLVKHIKANLFIHLTRIELKIEIKIE